MSAILKEDPPDLSVTNQSISPGLDRIVRHCLEKNPEQRFHSAHDLAFDLEALSGISQPGAAAAAAAAATSAPLSRRSLPGWLLAIPALVIGLLAGYAVSRPRPAVAPNFQRLTFRRGFVTGARFAPDGQTVIYSGSWDGNIKSEIFSKRLDTAGPIRLDLKEGELLSVSASGEMLLVHDMRYSSGYVQAGTLARAPVSGGAARDLLEDVAGADWAPDGQSIAVVHAPNWRYKLEYPAGKVLYETSGWISDPRVSPKGDVVAFLDHPQFGDDRGDVAMIDRAGHKTVLAAGWASAQGIAWSPQGDEIWFTASDTGSDRRLWAVTPSGRRRFIAAAPGEMTVSEISKSGQVLFLHGRQQIGVLGLAAGETKERDLSALDWSRAPILSADAKTLVFSEEGEGGGLGYSVFLRKMDGSAAGAWAKGRGWLCLPTASGFWPDSCGPRPRSSSCCRRVSASRGRSRNRPSILTSKAGRSFPTAARSSSSAALRAGPAGSTSRTSKAQGEIRGR